MSVSQLGDGVGVVGQIGAVSDGGLNGGNANGRAYYPAAQEIAAFAAICGSTYTPLFTITVTKAPFITSTRQITHDQL